MMQSNRQQGPEFPKQVWFPLIIGLALSGGMWLGFQLQARSGAAAQGLEFGLTGQLGGSGTKVQEVLRFIDARYLEHLPQKDLQEAAIKGILQQLDPHSSYISSEELEGVNEGLSGGFEGVGIEFSMIEDTISVVGVVPNGPSDKVGVKVGDKIIRIGDSLVAGVGLDTKGVIKYLKGPAGTSVGLVVWRRGEGELRFDIKRGEIPMPSIDVAYMLGNGIGYIKINRFSSKTYKEFMEALQALVEEGGLEHLVLDLRYNSGGYLEQSTDILSQLFDQKRLLVYTEGRSHKRKEYFSTGKFFFKVNKVAVLIDEGSASASEIVAGAIQDNDRGIVVGRRSYGKGLVQEQYDLSDRSALRLTVARYYTPSGRLIQRPYEAGGREAYYGSDLEERDLTGELFHRDSIRIKDSTKYYTTGGRVVYGGGGIMPDFFVPLDSMFKNRYFAAWSSQLSNYAYAYYASNMEQFTRYITVKDFVQRYEVGERVLEDFLVFCKKRDLGFDEASWKRSKVLVALYLKAYFAKQLFRDRGYYQVLHTQDPVLKRAVGELLRQGGGATANK